MSGIADELELMFSVDEPTNDGEQEQAAETTTPEVDTTAADAEAKPVVEPWRAEIDELKSTNTQLLQKLDQLLQAKPGQVQEPVQEPVKVETEKEFVNAEEYDKILGGDVKAFNEALNRAVKHGFEQAMLAVPEAVQSRVMASVDSKTQIRQYFSANQDLYPHRKILGVIAHEVLERNPSLANNAAKLLEEAGNDLRKRFNLAAPNQTKPPVKQTPPTDAGGRAPASPTPKKTEKAPLDIAAQIAEQFES